MHNTILRKLLFIISGLLLVATLILPLAPSAQAAQAVGGIRDFAQVAPGRGWLLMDGRLFWTNTDGRAWSEITPQTQDGAHVEAVQFIDAAQGRAFLSDQARTAYTIANTSDAGQTWSLHTFELPGLDDRISPVAAVHLGWRDASLGWLVFQLATGSNFSAGRLFLTQDGGETWAERITPLGEPAYFLDANTGWTAGGPAGDKLYHTSNSGKSWQSVQVGTGPAYYSLPQFGAGAQGFIALVRMQKGVPVAQVYRSTDRGSSWTLLGRASLEADTPAGIDLPASMSGPDEFTLHLPATGRTLGFVNGQLLQREDAQGRSTGIVSLSMSGSQTGWAHWSTGDCTSSSSGLACRRQEQLLGTRDGGLSWQALTLPVVSSTTISGPGFTVRKEASQESGTQALVPDQDTQPYVGHGFDMCQIGTLSQLQTWWSHSPYSAVNLYIGGSMRACANAALSASFLSQLHAQGWRFIPTWVGPQASCSFYADKISWDVETAYRQGITQADAALVTARSLGLTGSEKSGTVIYYDLEGYNVTDPNCRASADAFVSGWTGRMQAYGNLGAVYGASWASAPSDWSSIANVPDALWVANWYDNAGLVSFDPTATVWDAYGLSNDLWSNHQRLRQYAGGHNETWGGQTFNIDSSVLDGPLTVPDGTANLGVPPQPLGLSPAESSIWPRTTDTWLFWKTTGDTCTLHVWGGSIDFTTPASCSQYHLGVNAGGAYSWRVTATNGAGSTAGPVWHFKIRPRAVTSLMGTPASGSRVDLSWQLSTDEPTNIDSYSIYADGKFVGTVGQGISSFQVKDLACLTVHSFYVRSVRQGVSSIKSNIVRLTTPSCAPSLLSPAKGSTTLSLRPLFQWGAVPDAMGYRLQVSSSTAFTSLWADALVKGTGWMPPKNLAPARVYYWRVRARGGFGNGNWSAPRSFTSANPPSTPALLAPVGDILIRGYTPLLDWSDSSLPSRTSFDRYELQVATDSAFASKLLDVKITGGDASLSSYRVLTPLPGNTRFYWRVRAFNSAGQYSAWSPKGLFRARIVAPALLGPADYATLPTAQPEFTWSTVTGASSYTLQVALDSAFTQRVLGATATGTSYTPTTVLPSDLTLYWRVRTNAVNGPSSWSLKGNFSVVP